MAKRRKSDLAIFEKLSPNCTKPRNKQVRRLTPHCVGGNLSAESILGLTNFIDPKSTNPASVHYAISKGRIGLGLEETNRSFTSSSAANDHEAITFEIANTTAGPDWRMSDEDINAWLDLAVDICRFYGFKKVAYQPKPANITGSATVESWIATWANSGEMIITLHNWYANKACPGPYFMRQIPWLVREMNKRLEGLGAEKFVGENSTIPSGLERPSTLCEGSKGVYVFEAQTKLNNHGANPKLTVDSTFGPLTKAAVVTFKKNKNLSGADKGEIDSATWTELDKAPVSTTTTTTVPTSNSEEFKPYRVRITAVALNIRSKPNFNSSLVRTLRNDPNDYHIIAEENGPIDNKGTIGKWGLLKSKAGWIALKYTKKV